MIAVEEVFPSVIELLALVLSVWLSIETARCEDILYILLYTCF